MDYKTMNSFVLLTIFVLIILLYLLNRRRENFDDHEPTNMNSSMNSKSNNNTNTTQENNKKNNTTEEEQQLDPNEFDVSIESMFKNLEKAEQYCDDMETRQSIREKEERQKIQDIAKQQFELQRRKIRELKRVVEHLKKQQKFKTDLRNKCQASTQFKLNEDTKTAKILAEGGLLDKQKTTLEVNVSDKLKEMLEDQPRFDRSDASNGANTTETFTNQNSYKSAPPRYSYDACPSVDTDKYVHISQLANKCYGCNPYALIEHSNYIRKDFE